MTPFRVASVCLAPFLEMAVGPSPGCRSPGVPCAHPYSGSDEEQLQEVPDE